MISIRDARVSHRGVSFTTTDSKESPSAESDVATSAPWKSVTGVTGVPDLFRQNEYTWTTGSVEGSTHQCKADGHQEIYTIKTITAL